MTTLARPESPPGAPRRLAYLDGLRAVAALTVMFHHAYLTAYPGYPTQRPGGPLGGVFSLLDFAAIGVPVFIAISGYSLMQPVLRNGMRLSGGVRRFAYKRARRILPPYLVAWLIAVLLDLTVLSHKAGTHWDSVLPLSHRGAIADLFMVQDILPAIGVNPGRNVNHVFWTVAVEVHIYLVFPLLLLAWRRWGFGRGTVAGLAAPFVVLMVSQRGGSHLGALSNLHPELYLIFVLGATAAVLGASGEAAPVRLVRAPWKLIAAMLMVMVVVAIDLKGRAYYAGNPAPFFLLEGAAAACVLAHIGTGQSRRMRSMLEWRPLVKVGVMSYSLYLMHAPLLELAWRTPHGADRGVRTAFMVLMLPVVVGVCWLFYRVVERPLLRPSVRQAERAELAPRADQIASVGVGATSERSRVLPSRPSRR